MMAIRTKKPKRTTPTFALGGSRRHIPKRSRFSRSTGGVTPASPRWAGRPIKAVMRRSLPEHAGR